MKKPKVGLTMIVKNEEKVIGNCLESVFATGVIDYYHIVDTGSEDRTKEIILNTAKKYNIKGGISDYKFTNFADCRNKSLNKLRNKVDWAFWIDADELLIDNRVNKKNNEHFYNRLEKMDYAPIKAKLPDNSFFRTSFFRITPKTIWNGFVHEYIKVSGREAYLDDIFEIKVTTKGASWDNSQKLEKYLELLQEQVKIEPDEPRWTFFLAETYRHLKTPEGNAKAIEYYHKRIQNESGNKEEIYVSALMYFSLKMKTEGVSKQDIELIEKQSYPDRIENLLSLGNYYLTKNLWYKASGYAEQTKKYWRKEPRAGMYVDKKAYFYLAPMLYCVSCFYLKKYENAMEGLKVARTYGELNQTDQNLIKLMEKEIKKFSKYMA